jgi:hypothetical protein
VLCIVGGYLSYTGATIITEQDLENSMLTCALHMQRMVHCPQFTALRLDDASTESFVSSTDKDVFKVLRMVIEPWVDVSEEAMGSLFERFEALPPSSGASNVALQTLVSLKRLLAESDERHLKMKKAGNVDFEEEHAQSIQDLSHTIGRIADLLNEALASLATMVDEVEEKEMSSTGAKVFKLDFGQHPDVAQGGDKERERRNSGSTEKEKTDYEDVS